MADPYVTYCDQPEGPFRNAAAVTPSDTVPLTTAAAKLYVGVTGDVTLIPVGGASGVLFKAVPAGTVLPVRTSQVMATGTTATYIVAMW